LKLQLRIILLICSLALAAAPAAAQDPLSGKELVEALRQGGYNIYFRHGATDWSQDDHVSAHGDWTSCDPEQVRQLSAQGRAVAQRIGEAVRRLEIPVARVFTSEYCRARETARHMDIGPVLPIPDVMNMRAAEFVGGREAVIDRARRVISTLPPAGSNNIFVAHGNLMQAALGTYTVEAGAAIFAPQGNGAFRLVAQVSPEEWEMLAGRFANAEDLRP
jgi:broad specificity phosphatase PhoE